MKGEKIRTILIYMLILVLVGLVSYLIYFIIDENNKSNKTSRKNISKDTFTISEKCIFDTSYVEFNGLSNDESSIDLCDGYNRINFNDEVLNNMYVIYYNKDGKDNRSGIYIGSKKISQGASLNVKNVLGVFDDIIFLKKDALDETNVLAFDNSANQIYNLKTALINYNMDDPAFVEFAKTNPSINTKVLIDKVDPEGYSFNKAYFTFTTTSQCVDGQIYKGSIYKVNYNKAQFAQPVFDSYINC